MSHKSWQSVKLKEHWDCCTWDGGSTSASMGAISVGLRELNLLAHTQERTGKETRQNFCFSLVFLRWERELRCWWGWSSFKEIIVDAGEGQVLELGCQMYWARTLAEGSEQMGSLRLRWWWGRCYLQCQGLWYDHGSEWLRWVEDEIISWPWIGPMVCLHRWRGRMWYLDLISITGSHST